MKLAIVFDVPWPFRQIVDSRSRSRGASRQTSELTDLFEQPLMDQLGRHAEAGIVMHLPQIRLGAQPPGFWELALSICTYLSVTDSTFIQEPRDLSPAAQGFLQVNLVWSGALKNTLAPMSGPWSHFSAWRSARANVRKTPRVR